MKTLLIVDDEVDITEMLQAFLELVGYRVVIASDGNEALRKAASEKPDLVITDMMMPGMDGAELIQKLRAQPDTREVPIITMSANPVTLDFPSFRKPFVPWDLVREIRHSLKEDE